MYVWKPNGKPQFGTYTNYNGQDHTGFLFCSSYITNGECGTFDTKTYRKVTIDAVANVISSETLPITVKDMNTGESQTIYCPKGGAVCETIDITGGDIQISTPDDSKYARGSAVLWIGATKELTENDFAAIDIRF